MLHGSVLRDGIRFLQKMQKSVETEVSLRGALNQTSEAQMDALVAELCAE